MTYSVARRQRAGLACACTPGMGAFGQTATMSAAGPVNGIADLTVNLKGLMTRTSQFFGSSIAFDKAAYDALRTKIEQSGTSLSQLTRNETQQFVVGTIAQVAAALVQATQLSKLMVASDADRSTNQAAQAALIGPAQLMYDSASQVLRDVTPVTTPTATSGLGQGWEEILAAIPVAAWAAGAVVAIVLGALAVAAITYWVDSSRRLEYASTQAAAICAAATPPCTAQQRADLQSQLALGPFDKAAAVFTGVLASGISDAIVYTAVIGGSALALYLFFAFTPLGKKAISKMTGGGKAATT